MSEKRRIGTSDAWGRLGSNYSPTRSQSGAPYFHLAVRTRSKISPVGDSLVYDCRRQPDLAPASSSGVSFATSRGPGRRRWNRFARGLLAAPRTPAQMGAFSGSPCGPMNNISLSLIATLEFHLNHELDLPRQSGAGLGEAALSLLMLKFTKELITPNPACGVRKPLDAAAGL